MKVYDILSNDFYFYFFLDLDVLINNSGTNYNANLEEYPDEYFDKVLNLNVKRIFTLTQA